MSVLGIDRIEASLLNMLLPAGFIVGAPLVGWFVDRPGRAKTQVLAITLIAETLLWVAIARIAGGLGTVGMALVLATLGLTVGGMATVFWALLRDATPAPILGLTTGMLNLAPFLGSALLQVWTGAILDRVGQVGGHYPPEAFEQGVLGVPAGHGPSDRSDVGFQAQAGAGQPGRGARPLKALLTPRHRARIPGTDRPGGESSRRLWR